MKILVIGFPSGVQWRLMFATEVPDLTEGPGGTLSMTDDFGQRVNYTPDPGISYLYQDTDLMDAMEIEMMVRQGSLQQRAQSQFQANPTNMIMRPGGIIQ